MSLYNMYRKRSRLRSWWTRAASAWSCMWAWFELF